MRINKYYCKIDYIWVTRRGEKFLFEVLSKIYPFKLIFLSKLVNVVCSWLSYWPGPLKRKNLKFLKISSKENSRKLVN